MVFHGTVEQFKELLDVVLWEQELVEDDDDAS